ncbi:MAG TPA: response regulator [Aggregatilineales bacterium]|nr:response regulator [Anaerolineales bacterium]HRE47673.1 response regulator [Aggregatilineales bacterium]
MTDKQRETDSKLEKIRVLIVDDDRAICNMMANTLRTAGYEAFTAYDGASALAHYPTIHPHLVLLDFAMPEMNGYEVASAIRKLDGGARRTRIIFVTAYAQATLVALDFNISSDGFLTKPLLPSELLRHVHEFLNG